MNNNTFLYVIGLPKVDSAVEPLMSKFGYILKKGKKILSEISDTKIPVKYQNSNGTRTRYDVTSIIKTSKNQIIYTESDWNILKICDKLSKKSEGMLSKHDGKHHRESIRKKEGI